MELKIVNRLYSPQRLIRLLLKNRGITDIQTFLNPPPPSLNLKLSSAVKLILQAVKNNQNILIYGDYDVDGITAAAILWQSIYKITPKVTPFVPHRERDGYGIKAKSFFRFQAEKKVQFDLLITVDNGIVAESELAKIKAKQNIKIIITDHHLPDKKLKSADVVVHTTQTSGAAVSWFLAKELDNQADLGLAALGVVADCLPLVGINRSLVVHGLTELRVNPNPGIKQLITIAGLKQPALSAFDLGFALGPRLNAVGRLSDPTEALRLLCSRNNIQAEKYAKTLNSYNQNRQQLQKESLELAQQKIDLKHRLIFVSGNYNPGIIGLIAGRLTEKYYLPSIVISESTDISKGSCRSIPEINIIDVLRQHSNLFVDLGGHALAAGFSLQTSKIPKIKKLITAAIDQKLKNRVLKPTAFIDAEMKLSAVTVKNIKAIESLAPFGIGNPEPVFIFKNLEIVSKKVLGTDGAHLKLRLTSPTARQTVLIDAIAFKKGDLDQTLNIGDTINVTASLSLNVWNGTTSPQLVVKDIIKE